MANEVEVHELSALRGGVPAMPVPQIEKQTLSIGGAVSNAFNRGTAIVRITVTTDCRVEFGTAPAGAGDTILLYSGMHHDFAVSPNHKVIAVAA
jgi:hypothetical protein